MVTKASSAELDTFSKDHILIKKQYYKQLFTKIQHLIIRH